MYTILEQANAFRMAAERCNEQRLVGGKARWLLVPYISNAAFACELYLKAILKARGIVNTASSLDT